MIQFRDTFQVCGDPWRQVGMRRLCGGPASDNRCFPQFACSGHTPSGGYIWELPLNKSLKNACRRLRRQASGKTTITKVYQLLANSFLSAFDSLNFIVLRSVVWMTFLFQTS